MHTAWSANFTCSASASTVEGTATDWIPSSRQAGVTRRAVSPRLATSTFLNSSGIAAGRLWLDLEQRLAELHGVAVLREHGDDGAVDVGLDLVHQLHRLDDAQHLALLHPLAHVGERRGVGGR